MYYQYNTNSEHFKWMHDIYKETLFFVPCVSVTVITCGPAVRQEQGSHWLVGGVAVIVHNADSSIFLCDHDQESQET